MLQESIQIGLDLIDALIPSRAPRDAETLVEQRPVHSFHEAIA